MRCHNDRLDVTNITVGEDSAALPGSNMWLVAHPADELPAAFPVRFTQRIIHERVCMFKSPLSKLNERHYVPSPVPPLTAAAVTVPAV